MKTTALEDKIETIFRKIFDEHPEAMVIMEVLRTKIDTLEKANALMREALEFYGKGREHSNEVKETKGHRIEFGCGCCSGTVDNGYYDGSHDFDKSVIGETARSALAAVDILLKDSE
jgi:hypothetical protein